MYAYNSVEHRLRTLFNCPDFVSKINHWRSRTPHAGVMYDIYDTQMWNEIKDIDGERLVKDEHSLMLSLNVDWF